MELSKSKMYHNVINHIKTISTDIENNINDNHKTLSFGDSSTTQNNKMRFIKIKTLKAWLLEGSIRILFIHRLWRV